MEYGAHTGDPNLDNEYNKHAYQIPDLVQQFLVYFQNSVNEGSVFELSTLYEQTWPKLTEEYFEKRSWPEEQEVAQVVEKDPVSVFKHIYYKQCG